MPFPLTSEVRARLWREHLDGFARPGSPLSDAQRAAVREVIARLPELLDPRTDLAVVEEVQRRFAPSPL